MARSNALNDVGSDEATASFIRRVLCSHQSHIASDERGQPPPIDELLPPLTSSNAVDLQLYAFISILIKECVYTWYTKISPDHIFVNEVVQIIAHCTRSLEERARTVDFELLIFDDLAELLDAHIQAYLVACRAAESPAPSSHARLVYHTLRPHPALKPDLREQGRHGQVQENPADYSAYRQMLAQSLLAVLLPTEDLQNPCFRALVSEVTADLIIGNFIGNRICRSSFVYDIISKASKVMQARLDIKPWAVDHLPAQQNRLSRFGLLLTHHTSYSTTKDHLSFSLLLDIILRYISLIATAIRLSIQILVSSAFLPPRGERKTHFAGASASGNLESPTEPSPAILKSNESSIKPFLQYRIWRAGAFMIHFESKMPWVAAFLSLAQHILLFGPFELGGANSRLDRTIAHHVVSPIFPLSKHLPTVLLNLRLALFPGNALPSASQMRPVNAQASESDPDEAALSATAKRAAAFAVLNLIPQPLARIYFAVPTASPPSTVSAVDEAADSATAKRLSPQEEETELMVKGVEEILDAFSDEYMNRHFAFAVMERVLAALVPELAAGKTVAELLADRGVDVGLGLDFSNTAAWS